MADPLDIPVPPGLTDKQRDAFLAWFRYRRRTGKPGGCWGLYRHAVETRDQRRIDSMRRVRQPRQAKLMPAGTPHLIQRRFYNFLYTQGRCTFRAWWAWQCNKGPHPLPLVGA